jgi:DNA-binding response OmpR family regulator
MEKRILLIDDDKTTVKLIETRLKNEGFNVDTAYDGEEGLRKAQETFPELVILDVDMPKMDGYAFILALKKFEHYRFIPIIVLTSSEYLKPIFELKGAQDYLVKPVNFDVLLQKINHFMK